MKQLIYIVEVKYYKFSFDNAEEAIAFANTAKQHSTENVSVEMTVTFAEDGEQE